MNQISQPLLILTLMLPLRPQPTATTTTNLLTIIQKSQSKINFPQKIKQKALFAETFLKRDTALMATSANSLMESKSSSATQMKTRIKRNLVFLSGENATAPMAFAAIFLTSIASKKGQKLKIRSP